MFMKLTSTHFLHAGFQPKDKNKSVLDSNHPCASSNLVFLLPYFLVLKVNCVFWVRNSGAINIHVCTLWRCGWAWCARTTNQPQCAG